MWWFWCGGVGGGGCLFYQMNMCQEACRQTERQKPSRFFLLLLSLSSLLFCSFFRCSAVLLFSLRDETQDATLCCLSAFNICLPLPHFPRTSISSSADFLPSSLFSRSYLSSCLLSASNLPAILQPELDSLYPSVFFPLCATLAAVCCYFLFLFSSLVLLSQTRDVDL